MKKILSILILLVSAISLNSCSKEASSEFDQTLLYGKWQSGTLFYKYASDFTGITWDEADDVKEEEGKMFTWTLISDVLTHIYVTEVRADGTRADVPKVYTVSKLTESELVYEDDFGKEFSFVKVK